METVDGRKLRELTASFSKSIPPTNAFEFLFENTSDAICILDERGNFVAVNRRLEELTGLRREHYTGKSFREFVPAKSLPEVVSGFLSVIQGKSARLELDLKTAAKKTLLFEVTSESLIKDGKNVWAIGIARDISDHKQAKNALQKSEEMFKTLMEEAPIGICNADLKGKITYINKRFEEATGYSREEIVGKNGFKLGIMSDETLKLFAKRMKERLMGKPNRPLEGRFKRKDGEWMWAETEGRVIKKFGIPVGFQLIAKDITERKRAEEERKRFEESLSALNIYSRDLNTAQSMEEIYRLTFEAIKKTLGFEIAFLMIVEGNMLRVVDHLGYPKSFSMALPLDGSKRGISVKVAKTGRTIYVPDAEKDDDWVEFMSGIRSAIEVPVKIGNQVLGVIGVNSEKLDAFDEKDQELLEILASHAATAMSNLKHAENLEANAYQIRETQKKFERLFMDNPEAAVYVDSAFHILDANPRFSELFGYSLDEVKGRHINDVIVPRDKVKEGEMLDKKALKGYVSYETDRRRKDGSLVPVSVSAAPITVEDQPLGYVGLYRDIAEARMWEERLSALNFFSGKINAASNFGQVYELTLEAMEKTLGFEHAAFMNVDKGNLRIASYRGYPEPLSLRLPLDGSKKGVTVRAATTRKPVLVSDVTKDKDYVEGTPGIRSELAVPVEMENTLVGVLDVESRKLEAFNERDVMLLQILASHAATAISSLEKRREIEMRSSQLASLMKSSAEIISTTELRQRLRKIAEAIKEMGWRRVVLYVTDENLEMRSPEDMVSAGITDEERGFLWEKKQRGEVWRERFGSRYERFRLGGFFYLPWSDPLVRKSFSEDNVPSKLPLEEMVDWNPQDLLIAPLRLADGSFVGMISIDDPSDGRRPTKESLAPLELFMHQAAVAIENAQLFLQLNEAKDKVKEYADQLELKVEQRTHELTEAQNRLLKAERLAAIGEIAAMVGHDLRNPLAGIGGAAYYLRTKFGPNLDQRAKEMFELIEKDIDYSNNIITDLLEYSREIRLETEAIYLKSIIGEALSLARVPPNIEITDLTRNEPKIEVDFERMKRVFVNIIKNAVDAMPEGGKLTIESKESDGNLEIAFTDTGTGMSEETLGRLWTPLFTTKAKGMGLGLSICKRFVEAHGGSISAASKVGKGTTFTVVIPLESGLEGGESTWINPQESLLSTTMKA